MIKRVFNRIFKPDFIYIGGAIFKRENITGVHVDTENKQVVISLEVRGYDESQAIQCDSVIQAMDVCREAEKQLC